ncbi:hypothetical protein [Streptomyces albireticuli]|uniref:Uncharacterized protein n=1 Tax=Streptomyces albireticuli TaxID=1940 RepID=A0A2A2D783_9ACTN|nr:hypothetical protein [Streptomyces albireticuli]MCD9194267.1 hypothetical protein [Streptomyces albireticuli]PAU47375.1 hypothetical protein CK936_19010 [Streptomyces albireticuli]
MEILFDLDVEGIAVPDLDGTGAADASVPAHLAAGRLCDPGPEEAETPALRPPRGSVRAGRRPGAGRR